MSVPIVGIQTKRFLEHCICRCRIPLVKVFLPLFEELPDFALDILALAPGQTDFPIFLPVLDSPGSISASLVRISQRVENLGMCRARGLCTLQVLECLFNLIERQTHLPQLEKVFSLLGV